MSAVVIVDAGGANLGSVRYALQRLGVEPVLASDAATIRAADRVILPGVGASAPAMARLRELDLVDTLRSLQRPLFGICLGMQLLFEGSDEGGGAGLGLLPGRVTRLPAAADVRVPHIGWSRLQRRGRHPLLAGVDDGAWAYFVHSYAAPASADCVAACDHGGAFAALVQRGRVAGAQFHPERSAATGATILRNFLAWNPA